MNEITKRKKTQFTQYKCLNLCFYRENIYIKKFKNDFLVEACSFELDNL